MRKMRGALLAVGCLLATAEANAHELGRAITGITYFNRPGATLDEHQTALDRCKVAVDAMADPNIMLFTAGATYNSTYSPGANAGAALVLLMVDSARLSAAVERAENTHFQNCMVSQGWRVVRLENTAGRRMARMRQPELAAQLAPMITATEPEGEVVRAFANDLTTPSSLTPVPTGDGRFISLSRLALPAESAAAERRREARRMPSQQTREEAEAARAARRQQAEAQAAADAQPLPAGFKEDGGPPLIAAASANLEAAAEAGDESHEKVAGGGLTAEELAALPADATLITYRQRGAIGAIVFRRVDSDIGETFMVGVPRAPQPRRRSDPPPTLEDAVVTVAVPPGRWRMDSMSLGNVSVSLCMGSPAFDIAQGEAVYIGDFNFGADPFLPDMSLAAAQDNLAAIPQIRDRLSAARYENGSTGVCTPAQHLYAYALPVTQIVQTEGVSP